MYARAKNFTGGIEISRYAMCPVCGRRLHRTLDSWGDWDGESYTCEYCARNDNQSDSESMSVYDAAQIWLSNGKDEDYTFGYSEEELENALS